MPSLPSSSAYHDLTESESISSDSDDSSTSSESSLSEPPRKIKSRRGTVHLFCLLIVGKTHDKLWWLVSTGTDDEILPASDSENISESATIVDLTASDDEYTGNFFASFKLDDHEVVAEPEAPVEADLTPLEPFESPGPVSTPPLQTGEMFATPTLQASGSFVIDPSLDNPWEGNRLFNF